MQQVDKRRRLKDLGYDIYALSETHLQQHLEQAETHQFSEYFCLWGHNPEQRHFAGVGVLAKKSKFWDAKIIHWDSNHPCHRFYQDSRLIACQLWLGRGGVCITIYAVYGMSGARWERPKRQYFHELLEAIQLDRIERGPNPTRNSGFPSTWSVFDFTILAGPSSKGFASHARFGNLSQRERFLY